MTTGQNVDGEWSRAFAKQALADLDTRDLLALASAPQCHRLHLLQMGAEKLCKAFLCRANGIDALGLTHCVVGKTLPVILRSTLIAQPRKRGMLESEMKRLRSLSREIETLSPSCNTDSRPDNVEYPWESASGIIQAPVAHRFTEMLDESRTLTTLTKLMRTAAESYLV